MLRAALVCAAFLFARGQILFAKTDAYNGAGAGVVGSVHKGA